MKQREQAALAALAACTGRWSPTEPDRVVAETVAHLADGVLNGAEDLPERAAACRRALDRYPEDSDLHDAAVALIAAALRWPT